MRPSARALPVAARRAAAIGAAALVVTAIGGWLEPRAFFEAWLVAWLFVLGIALAAMMIVMIHELTGGEWGLVLRRPLEAAMLTLPACAVLALPLAFGLPELFAWARPEPVASGHVVAGPRWYLDAPSLLVRNAVWLVVWSAFALALARSFASAAARDPRRRRIAVAGLLVYLPTITLFAYDWIAALVPQWSSTSIGVRLGAAQFLAAFPFAVIFVVAGGRVDTPPAPDELQDFGNLLLTLAMFWAYIAFTQFLIVWGADLPRETAWYGPRMQTSWRWLAAVVLAADFVVPFAAMLFRAVKRSRRALTVVCVVVVAGQWLDCVWLTLPSLRPQGFALGWTDFAASIAVAGLWLALVIAVAQRLPLRAPSAGVEEAKAHG